MINNDGRFRMKVSTRFGLVASVALIFAGSAMAQQQPAQPAPPQLPQAPNMTFFVVGTGPGKGADLGGIEGADRHCQQLAERHGAGRQRPRPHRQRSMAEL